MPRTILTTAIAVLLTMSMAGCSSQVIVDDESVASWVTVNNSFSGGNPDHVSGSTETRHLRTGYLMQMGNFEDCELGFYGIQFESDGSVITDQSILDTDGTPLLAKDGRLLDEKFTWINVEGAAPGTYDTEPVDLESAFYLYPSQKDIDYHCREIDDCAFGGASCTCDIDLAEDSSCIRGRLLHGDLTFKGLLTFWQGSDGYTMTAEQKTGKNDLNNEQVFESKGDIKVEIYREDWIDEEWQMVLIHTFDRGEVNVVRILNRLKSGDHGMKHDPPWTPEHGC